LSCYKVVVDDQRLEPGPDCEQSSRREPGSPTTPRWRDLAGRFLACPTTSRKRHQPTRHPSRAHSATFIMADFVGSTACPWGALGMPRYSPSPGSKGRTDRPARQPKGARMRQFEQDWLELGSRVARSLHYQHRRNLRQVEASFAAATPVTLPSASVR
jgi:hypothetical protein